MKSFVVCVFTPAVLAMATTPCQAITINIHPADHEVTIGSVVDVAIVISELGAGIPPSIAAFDLDVTFDANVLAFVNAVFGDPIVGDQLDLAGNGAIAGVTAAPPGVVNLFELSLDSPADLDHFQAGTFILARLRFVAVFEGVSPLALSVNALADVSGNALAAETLSDSITVRQVAVPEPGSFAFLLTGLAAFLAARRDKRAQFHRIWPR